MDWQAIWYNEKHQLSETGGVTVARKEADRLKAPGAKTARLQTLRTPCLRRRMNRPLTTMPTL